MKPTEYRPGPTDNTVVDPDGRILRIPAGWECLPPGDPGLTRRVKAAGEFWAVSEKVGRKIFSRGVWVPAGTIARIRAELQAERSTDTYARRRARDADRRDRDHAAYVETFHREVLAFLDFPPVHAETAERLARAVTEHATPVGSGTVARTQRIPVERRAEAAVIAWMRHQTTDYDSMRIARVKGLRREVRRDLGEQSRTLLERYRRGRPVDPTCPIQAALARPKPPAPDDDDDDAEDFDPGLGNTST